MRVVAAALTASFLLAPAPARQEPAAADVLKSASAYALPYVSKISGVVLDEQAMVTEVVASRALVPKRVASDVTLVNVNDRVVSIRDSYAVDSKPIRERALRIAPALQELTSETLLKAQQYARDSYHLFIATIVLRGTEPLLALAYLEPVHHPKLQWRIDGRRTINGTPVVGLRFEETRERNKVYLLQTPGNASGSGRFWVDPASGAIHQIELWLESPTESASVTVQLTADAERKMLLPAQLSGTFSETELGAGPATSASARNLSRKVEVIAKYSIYKQAR